MARRRIQRTAEARRIQRIYGVVGLVFLLFMGINFLAENYVYTASRDTYQSIIESEQIISNIENQLYRINHEMLSIAAGVASDPMESDANIVASFAEIKRQGNNYKAMENVSDKMLHRFTVAEYAIRAYERKIDELKSNPGSGGSGQSIYIQEVAPLQAVANEMLSALTDIGTQETARSEGSIATQHGFSQGILALLTLLLFTTMTVVGVMQIRSMQEIHEKESELDEQAARLDRTRQKMFDAAHMNILTGLNNRYALESTLEDLIGEVQFNIAVFDMDNFRAVNDQLGYEVGDEYLSTLAERLKEEYAENCDIYNISGNEFALIFGDDLSDMQAQQLAEQVRQMMGSPVMVAGVVLQNSCSGALYHVLPSENVSITSLLMRLDSALHEAKRQGGNRMFYI